MRGVLVSLSRSRAACSVRTMNSYRPVSGAKIVPSQRMEKRSGSKFFESGPLSPKSNCTVGSIRSRTRFLSRKPKDLKYSPRKPCGLFSWLAFFVASFLSEGVAGGDEGVVWEVPIKLGEGLRYCGKVTAGRSVRGGLF